MELLFLLLLIPVVWLMLLPSRVASTLKRHRYASAAAVAAIALGGLLLLQLNPPTEGPADYAQGDTALRALLE
jgi:ferric-dicitrate binding protein FerR (iron transport regulator)